MEFENSKQSALSDEDAKNNSLSTEEQRNLWNSLENLKKDFGTASLYGGYHETRDSVSKFFAQYEGLKNRLPDSVNQDVKELKNFLIPYMTGEISEMQTADDVEKNAEKFDILIDQFKH